MNISKYKISAQSFKVSTTILSFQKVNKVPLLLKQQRKCKNQFEERLFTPINIENPSKYWIQSIIHENVCWWFIGLKFKIWWRAVTGPALIKVKDSAPTVICTLAIKIAKHRGGRWGILQNKAHGQNINFLLVNSASRECIGGIMLGNFKIHNVLSFMF